MWPATWSVPPMWVGRTVAILASGPGMSQEVADAVRDVKLPTIVINTTYLLAPWADILYAADQEWWINNPDALKFLGLKVTCTQPIRPDVLCLENSGREGFDDRPSCIRTGQNSGYQAVHIAAHAKPSRILLFGFNMSGHNWHGKHPQPLRTTPLEDYLRWLSKWDGLAVELRARGVTVINCTPDSALRCFPTMDAALALKGTQECSPAP